MITPEMMARGFKHALVPLDGSMVAGDPASVSWHDSCAQHGRGPDPRGRAHQTSFVEEAPTELGKYTAMMERMLDEADTYLRSVVALPAFAGLKVMTTVRTGEAPQEIIASAKEVGADVIVLTTHGRTGLKRLLFGSVAEAAFRDHDARNRIFCRQILHALEEATRHGRHQSDRDRRYVRLWRTHRFGRGRMGAAPT